MKAVAWIISKNLWEAFDRSICHLGVLLIMRVLKNTILVSSALVQPLLSLTKSQNRVSTYIYNAVWLSPATVALESRFPRPCGDSLLSERARRARLGLCAGTDQSLKGACNVTGLTGASVFVGHSSHVCALRYHDETPHVLMSGGWDRTVQVKRAPPCDSAPSCHRPECCFHSSSYNHSVLWLWCARFVLPRGAKRPVILLPVDGRTSSRKQRTSTCPSFRRIFPNNPNASLVVLTL